MKRSGWAAGLMFVGLAGLVAAASSRSGLSPEQSEPAVAVTAGSGECDNPGGAACSCGTGVNRAALLKARPPVDAGQ